MERADTQTGIIGGGLIADDPRSDDLEMRINERAERLYRLRLVRRLLLVWAGPANIGLLGLTASVLLFRDPTLGTGAAFALTTAASVAASVRLLYQQHFKVRSVESELRELRCAHRENMLDEFSTGDLLGAQKRYWAQLPDVIDGYRLAARKHRWKSHTLQALVIVGSIVTAVATSASMSFVDARWAAVVISTLVAISAAMSAYGKYQERGASLRRTADALEREYESVELRVGRYRRFGDEREAYAEFADTVGELCAERVRVRRDQAASAP